MTETDYAQIFTDAALKDIFPSAIADSFFEALYGDATEGAYDISLKFSGHAKKVLNFELHLTQRPGKCLACNLTYGLPEVFKRHPVINLNGLTDKINGLLKDDQASSLKDSDLAWEIGRTQEVSKDLHVVPLTISF